MRRCKPLTLYQDSDMRVQRDHNCKLSVEQHGEFVWDETPQGFWWALTTLWGYDHEYIVADRSEKLRVNRKYTEIGKKWIAYYRLLLASPDVWPVRCHDWNGQGTRCPCLQQKDDGEWGCPVKFSRHGYCETPRYHYLDRPLPEECPGPLTWSRHINVCAPGVKDEHGFTVHHLARIRYIIRNRVENPGGRALAGRA